MGNIGKKRKTELIHVRTVPEERAVLQAIAHQDRRRPSETLRELVRAEAARRGLWPPQEAQAG